MIFPLEISKGIVRTFAKFLTKHQFSQRIFNLLSIFLMLRKGLSSTFETRVTTPNNINKILLLNLASKNVFFSVKKKHSVTDLRPGSLSKCRGKIFALKLPGAAGENF